MSGVHIQDLCTLYIHIYANTTTTAPKKHNHDFDYYKIKQTNERNVPGTDEFGQNNSKFISYTYSFVRYFS